MKHIAYSERKPVKSGVESTPDGAVNGNGDLGIILGNAPDGLRVYISKNDIWYGAEDMRSGGLRPLGYIDIPIRADLYSNFHSEQDMDEGEIRCRFGLGTSRLNLTIRVLKTINAILIEKTGDIELSPPVLKIHENADAGRYGDFDEGGVQGIYRIFDGEECSYETHVFAAMKEVEENTFITYVATNHDIENPLDAVIAFIKGVTPRQIENRRHDHKKAWKRFWKKSGMTLSDEDLENSWYASQYLSACCMGNRQFPPGLYGNFVTVEHPNWHSDYHLNYNYQAPFYGVFSSNHTELSDCYMAPLEQFMKKGERFAQEFECGGIVYPVAIAPMGLCAEYDEENKYAFERLFLGQRSNALHAADIAVFRWRATHDLDFARDHAYPYIKAALTFIENYGEYKEGIFSVKNDAVHEVPVYRNDFNPKRYPYLKDINNNLTMGMLRLCLSAATEMAQALGIDADRCDKWTDMLDALPDFPTTIRGGRKVFRYTMKGERWHGDNDVGLQHIYPAGCIDFTSEKNLYKTALNTVRAKIREGAFDDDNAVSSIFPMAARLRIDPALITKGLRDMNRNHRLGNMLYEFGGGGIEYNSIHASTLNEMAVQRHGDTIYLFPDWDTDIDCDFRNLLTDGGFLVSASMEGGEVRSASIVVGSYLPELTVELPSDDFTCKLNGRVYSSFCDRTVYKIRKVKPGDEIIFIPNN